jgi:sulfur-oxidizing protein SoxB
MPPFDRREFLKIAGLSAAASALPAGLVYGASKKPKGYYDLPMKGTARIIHMTDVHGQLKPVYFREPNVNLGIGPAYGRPPHMVGKTLLDEMGLKANSPEAYVYTYLDFEKAALKYGRTGGLAHAKTLIDSLRKQAGGRKNTLTLDGGDLWQGSGTALWTRGVDMVEASNIMGVDVMVGHWEFTYRENEVLSNVALFKGDFIGQNVRVKEDALFGEEYPKMVEKFDGRGLFDEDTGHAFRPYVIKNVNGARICVVGQAFPRTGNANPQEFFPDWSFGLREGDMIDLVKNVRETEKPDAVILLSHNGMDVDVKMGERVPGLNAVFGGQTHDGMPQPLKVKNASGGECWVTNAGSNSKFVGVMDLDIQGGKLKGMHYNMLPIISDWLPADKEMEAYINQMRSAKYTDKVIEARSKKYYYNKGRVGKTFEQILGEKLAKADRTLYRRGNFMGTWDQVICNALIHEYDSDVSLSAGVRWGTSTLKGDWITMEDVMTQCALTYGETYVRDITGKALIGLIEGVADNLFDPDPYLQSGGDMVRVGGLDYTIDPSKTLGTRITEVTLDSGEVVDPDKVYRVSGWATVDRVPDGRLIWDIVRDYIVAKKSKDNVLRLPRINRPKLIGVSKNPGIADYQGKSV